MKKLNQTIHVNAKSSSVSDFSCGGSSIDSPEVVRSERSLLCSRCCSYFPYLGAPSRCCFCSNFCLVCIFVIFLLMTATGLKLYSPSFFFGILIDISIYVLFYWSHNLQQRNYFMTITFTLDRICETKSLHASYSAMIPIPDY